jgi:hypothetical protein
MKNFRIIILSNCLLFICFFLKAQENVNLKKIAVKLYVNGFYKYTERDDYNGLIGSDYAFLDKNKGYDFGGLSFALEVQRNNFFSHEFEIMPLKIRQNDKIKTILYTVTNEVVLIGVKTTSIESALRYQLTYYFIKDKVVLPSIGLSPQLFYNFNKFDPSTTGYFGLTAQNIGLNLAIIPGLAFKLNKKLSIDLNIPIGIYEIKYDAINSENPNLPIRDQKDSKIIGEFIPKKVNIRIGIIYNL